MNRYVFIVLTIILLGFIFVFMRLPNKKDVVEAPIPSITLSPTQSATDSATISPLKNNKTTGVTITDLVIGKGEGAKSGDVLKVHYTGKLTDGTVFDTSLKEGRQPFTFTLGKGDVIKGWDEGLLGMKAGGKRRLTIAPEYGYGEHGSGIIPPNATLIFEVELLAINP